ncbi:MAG: hypothetical protein ACYDAS_04385 [Patescibacteria group bacterium]
MGEVDTVTEQQEQYRDLVAEEIYPYLRSILDTNSKAFIKVKGDGDPAYITGHPTLDMDTDIFLVFIEERKKDPPSVKIAIEKVYLNRTKANIRIIVNDLTEIVVYTMDGQTKTRRYIKDKEGVFKVFLD